MIYEIVEQALLDRFKLKRLVKSREGSKDLYINLETHAETRVNVCMLRENRITTQLPLIVIRFDDEEMREEEFKRGVELIRMVNPEVKGPYNKAVSDLSEDVEHPEAINLFYEFIVYARHHIEAKRILHDIKSLFPQRGFLKVLYGGDEEHNLDMLRVRGPYQSPPIGQVVLNSQSGNDDMLEVWGIRYMIEAYEENIKDRKYEVRITKTLFDYNINDGDVLPIQELDMK